MAVLRFSPVFPHANTRPAAGPECCIDARHLAASEGGGRQAQPGRLAAASVSLHAVYGSVATTATAYSFKTRACKTWNRLHPVSETRRQGLLSHLLVLLQIGFLDWKIGFTVCI